MRCKAAPTVGLQADWNLFGKAVFGPKEMEQREVGGLDNGLFP